MEVYLGDESIVQLPYRGGNAALEELARIEKLSQQDDEPYSPVGWSKCASCGFRERCWKIAEAGRDVALVYELDQGTATALKQKGVTAIEELLRRFDKDSLAELRKPRGNKMVRVGSVAERILQQAEALRTNKEKLLAPLDLPASENMVMFDLEGLPPQFDELDKVYLWGMQVYGRRPGKFNPALAGVVVWLVRSRSRRRAVFGGFLAGAIITIVLFFDRYRVHNYYLLPLVFPLSFFAAYAVQQCRVLQRARRRAGRVPSAS